MTVNRIAFLIAACGLAAGAQAQPRLIIGSGATLQENFFRADASTNDFIDVDGDGRAGSLGSLFPDQLAPNFAGCLTPPFQCGDGPGINDTQWLFLYRITGSGNGVLEFDTFSLVFDDFGDGFDTDGNGTPNNDPGNSIFAEAAVWNRLNLIVAGILQPFGNPANRGGSPYLPIPGSFFPGVTGDGSGAGLHVDFSASDVPLTWFGIVPGDNSPIRAPGAAGYGGNPRTALAKDGTPLDQDNLLRPLSNLNINLANPDAFTAYDFPVSVTPVAAPVNYGVGMSEIKMSDLRHLSATGRRINGENLIKITRDSGSGTRNAFMNTIGLDPSFGIGENIGLRTTLSINDLVGPNYTPSNKGGSSRVDATVANTRLGVGHTGAERLIENGLLLDQRMDTLAIISDIKGGTVAARPTIENVIDGGPNGYNVSGPAAFTFRGDPRNAPAALGGWGWDPSETGPNPFAGNPVPANPAASAYWNNIARSIAAFVEVPGGPTTDFMPGELLAQSYLLTAAPSQVPTDFDPDGVQPIEIVANPNLNPNVQNYSLNDPGSVFASPLMQNFNFNSAGRVPTRTANITYTDGNTGNHYVTVNGTLLAYNSILPNSSPNKIAGDFNNDGVRDIDDLAPMVAAWRSRNAGPAWTGSGLACFELLGDHDMDGNFTMNDIRYAADGLAMVSTEGDETVLNRFLGFKAVDDAFAGNFFGTTLLRGTYKPGDSAADIAGSNATPGWAPNGWDGVVDCADIQYVIDNFGDWTDIEQAVYMDLSADMNGDLVVDADDVDFVLAVLETVRGDLNFDGVADAADVAILTANLGTGTTYCQGDLNFDGVVDEQDLALIALGCNAADIAEPFGILDLADIIAFSDAFVNQNAAADLAPPQGVFDLADINAFVSAFLGGCP